MALLFAICYFYYSVDIQISICYLFCSVGFEEKYLVGAGRSCRVQNNHARGHKGVGFF